ncbi:hypothetical protein D3C77_652790 [compost metagenome]
MQVRAALIRHLRQDAVQLPQHRLQVPTILATQHLAQLAQAAVDRPVMPHDGETAAHYGLAQQLILGLQALQLLAGYDVICKVVGATHDASSLFFCGRASPPS